MLTNQKTMLDLSAPSIPCPYWAHLDFVSSEIIDRLYIYIKPEKIESADTGADGQLHPDNMDQLYGVKKDF